MFPVHLDIDHIWKDFCSLESFLDQKFCMIQPGDDIKWEKSHISPQVDENSHVRTSRTSQYTKSGIRGL